MAEIKIEKKKPVWPWVVLILILGVLAYFFWYSNRGDIRDRQEIDFKDTLSAKNEVVDNDISAFYTSEEGVLEDYNEYVLFLKDSHALNLNHESDFHRKALEKLIDATREQGVIQGIDIQRNLDEASENAEKITHDVHQAVGVQVKKAASEITDALKKIQKKRYETLESEREALETAVSNMNGMRTIDDQQDKIFAFYDQAAQLLKRMYELETNSELID